VGSGWVVVGWTGGRGGKWLFLMCRFAILFRLEIFLPFVLLELRRSLIVLISIRISIRACGGSCVGVAFGGVAVASCIFRAGAGC
jgi:hypothetical protein